MTVIAVAPGKLLLTGAYAVLEGAPAIVMAVDRFAYARYNATRALRNSRPEVEAAAQLLNDIAPCVDVSELEHNGKKLGLGSSAAAAVAASAVLLHKNGIFDANISTTSFSTIKSSVYDKIFQIAYQAHSRIQSRGSGIDVAASTYGGTLSISRTEKSVDIKTIQIPNSIVWRAFSVHRPIRTSDILEQLNISRSLTHVSQALELIKDAAIKGVNACYGNCAQKFLQASHQHIHGLSALGVSLGFELVIDEVHTLQKSFDPKEVILLPSGAGGGDIVIWLSTRAPSQHEIEDFKRKGVYSVPLQESTQGLHWRHE